MRRIMAAAGVILAAALPTTASASTTTRINALSRQIQSLRGDVAALVQVVGDQQSTIDEQSGFLSCFSALGVDTHSVLTLSTSAYLVTGEPSLGIADIFVWAPQIVPAIVPAQNASSFLAMVATSCVTGSKRMVPRGRVR
jgi:hypothetical protein